ncbi:MAG: cytidylate kinase-like family protein [Ruminococcaceae bacterium]|nr:cytidylate kinase-like family protein [Oscillospiraceae bacterium]
MSEHLVICLARQFGSGGRTVGLAAAKAMNLNFFDKELLAVAAEKSGILPELIERNDERAASGLKNVLAGGESIGKASSFSDYITYQPDDAVQNAIADAIRAAAAEGPCVIIGRCADYVLRGHPRMLSVFVHAPLEVRIKRVARLHNLPEDDARALIRKTDRSRANYYSFYTDRDWGGIDNYHLALGTGRLEVEQAAELLRCAAKLYCGAD